MPENQTSVLSESQTPVLSVKGIVKRFPGVVALKGVDFDVKKGEVHALCGENGAGKSTLMSILAGVYKQDEGDIFLNGEKVSIDSQKNANDMGISIVYQERSLVNGMNVAENIFAARQPTKKLSLINWKKLYKESEDLLTELNIKVDPRTMLGALSPAMQQMVEIAKALSLRPNVLILDEPTATISEKEVGALFKLIEKLKNDGMAIIYISHRLSEIFKIADRITVFKDGRYIETADVSEVDNNWLVNRMVGRDLLLTREERSVPDDIILEGRNLTSSLFKDVSFKLKRGEILGFSGLAGAGRTEVFRALFGKDPLDSGEVIFNGQKVRIRRPDDAIRIGIGYMPEDRKEQGLFLNMSIAQNMVSACINRFSSFISINTPKINRVVEEYKEKLNIMTPSIEQKVVNLSGGNQQKVLLAKWMIVHPEVLIVDEPTRGVDVGAKSEIYALLREMANNGMSIIFISSELPEVLALSDRMYVMYEGRITGEVNGKEASEEGLMAYASGITATKEEKENA